VSPISLTDDELQEIMRAARLVPHDLRQTYLEKVAVKLRGNDLGPGLVHRVAFEVARGIAWDSERAAATPPAA
jgi:hypothetical protein